MEKLNLFLANHTLIGLGYVPDEDQDTVEINCHKKIVIPTPIDPFFKGKASDLNEMRDQLLNSGLVGGAFGVKPDGDTDAEVSGVSQQAVADSGLQLATLRAAFLPTWQQTHEARIQSLVQQGFVGFVGHDLLHAPHHLLKAVAALDQLPIPLCIGLDDVLPADEPPLLKSIAGILAEADANVVLLGVKSTETLAHIRRLRREGRRIAGLVSTDWILSNDAICDAIVAGDADLIGSNQDPLADKGLYQHFWPILITRLHRERGMPMEKLLPLVKGNLEAALSWRPDYLKLSGRPSFVVLDPEKRMAADSALFGQACHFVVHGRYLWGAASESLH